MGNYKSLTDHMKQLAKYLIIVIIAVYGLIGCSHTPAINNSIISVEEIKTEDIDEEYLLNELQRPVIGEAKVLDNNGIMNNTRFKLHYIQEYEETKIGWKVITESGDEIHFGPPGFITLYPIP